VNAMRNCSTNCHTCPATDEHKKCCPEWIVANIVLDISQDLKKLKNSIVSVMVEDFMKEIMVVDDNDDIKQYTDMMYKNHDRYFA
jgi:hypothetical protein